MIEIVISLAAVFGAVTQSSDLLLFCEATFMRMRCIFVLQVFAQFASVYIFFTEGEV
jgi:hypothetical protein